MTPGTVCTFPPYGHVTRTHAATAVAVVAGVVAGRLYLRSTGYAPVRQYPGGCRNHRHEDGSS